MQNPERPLLDSLAHGLGVIANVTQKDPSSGQPIPKDSRWPAGNPAAWQTIGGLPNFSPNQRVMALACAILLGDREQRIAAEKAAIANLKQQKQEGFMGPEAGSIIYGIMWLIAILTMLEKGSTELKNLAAEWVQLVLFWLQAAPWAGQRSAEPGRVDEIETGLYARLASWARGDGSFPRQPGFTPPQGLILEQFAGTLEAGRTGSWKSLGVTVPPPAMPLWATMTPIHLFVGADSCAVVVEHNTDENTPPILIASRSSSGAVLTGPAADQITHRIRERSDNPSATISSDGLTAAYAPGKNPPLFPFTTVALPSYPRQHILLGKCIETESSSPLRNDPSAATAVD